MGMRLRFRARTLAYWIGLGLFARFCWKYVFPVHIRVKDDGFSGHSKVFK